MLTRIIDDIELKYMHDIDNVVGKLESVERKGDKMKFTFKVPFVKDNNPYDKNDSLFKYTHIDDEVSSVEEELVFDWLHTNDDFTNIYDNNDSDSIMLKCVEEMNELSSKLSKLVNSRTQADKHISIRRDIEEELTDVYITLAQLEKLLSVQDDIRPVSNILEKIHDKNKEYFGDGVCNCPYCTKIRELSKGGVTCTN